MSFYGYNVLSIPDKGAFLSHIRKLKPNALLFYGAELDFARQVAREFTDMIVIIRNWPDSELHKSISPTQWLNEHESQASGGLYLYTMNESGLSQEVIDWHLELMKAARFRGIHLVLLNPATGTWDTSDYPRLKPLLQYAGENRDLFVIGLHSYAGGVITSGIAGGNPDNAGVAPGQSGGRNLIPRDKWPRPVTDTTFHLGRHKWLMQYCSDNHIPMPRFGLTETGFDYLGDIGNWLNSLDHSSYTSINGWQTLKTQWVKWWGGYPDEDYVIQLEYAAKNLLQGLEFTLLYCYGDDGHWGNYRVDTSDVPMLLEQLSPATPTPPPFDYGAMLHARLNVYNVEAINLRLRADTNSAILATLADGTDIKISEHFYQGTDHNWFKVTSGNFTGYIADTANWRITDIPKQPPPETPKKAVVVIKIPGLSIEAARELVNNVSIQIETE